MDDAPTFEPDLIRSIFSMVWSRRKSPNIEDDQDVQLIDVEAGAGTSKKNNRSITADSGALKLSCELVRLFVTEAVERASIIAEAEGYKRIEASHLERVLPQLLLDF